MKHILTVAALAGLLGLSGCQSFDDRAECRTNADALGRAVRETVLFQEALRIELREGFTALEACQDRSDVCRGEEWLVRAEQLRLQHMAVASGLAGASEAYDAARCETVVAGSELSEIVDPEIDAPPPETWRGLHSSLDQTGGQIQRLIEGFRVYAR